MSFDKRPLNHNVRTNIQVIKILIRAGLIEKINLGKSTLYRTTEDGIEAIRLLKEAEGGVEV